MGSSGMEQSNKLSTVNIDIFIKSEHVPLSCIFPVLSDPIKNCGERAFSVVCPISVPLGVGD